MIVLKPVAISGFIFYSARNDYTSLDDFFSFGFVSRDGLLFRLQEHGDLRLWGVMGRLGG